MVQQASPDAVGPTGRHAGVEITRELRLSERERHLIEMHSVYNVLNIAVFRVDSLGHLLGDAATADRLMDEVIAWQARLEERDRVLEQLVQAPALLSRLLDWARQAGERLDPAGRAGLEEQMANLESIFQVLEARVAELLERSDDPEAWATLSVQHLRTNLQRALRAIERNAFGRWRVAFSAEERPPGAYLVEMVLRGRDPHTIRMPAVLEDVMRDVVANARKFTPPGGRIGVTVEEGDDGVRLAVEDDGRGIAEDEVEEVVAFGRRGRDSSSQGQPGGGFGLTKAFHVTRSFGGRMWIRSAPGAGTTVTVVVPRERGRA